jgi:hypothetical protein
MAFIVIIVLPLLYPITTLLQEMAVAEQVEAMA